jgi:hypothetical protein
MEFVYYKVNLKDVPDSILRKRGRSKVLHLRIASLHGPIELEFKSGDVIRTDDWKTIHALRSYRIPKVGIKNKPKGESVFSHTYHDHEEYKKVKVFKKARKTTKYQHSIEA